jgi:hypothetical protein
MYTNSEKWKALFTMTIISQKPFVSMRSYRLGTTRYGSNGVVRNSLVRDYYDLQSSDIVPVDD